MSSINCCSSRDKKKVTKEEEWGLLVVAIDYWPYLIKLIKIMKWVGLKASYHPPAVKYSPCLSQMRHTMICPYFWGCFESCLLRMMGFSTYCLHSHGGVRWILEVDGIITIFSTTSVEYEGCYLLISRKWTHSLEACLKIRFLARGIFLLLWIVPLYFIH